MDCSAEAILDAIRLAGATPTAVAWNHLRVTPARERPVSASLQAEIKRGKWLVLAHLHRAQLVPLTAILWQMETRRQMGSERYQREYPRYLDVLCAYELCCDRCHAASEETTA